MNDNLKIRVYYEDTDAGGVVYYANYLKYCERGRSEYLRARGFENTSIKDEKGVLFVVRQFTASYHSPARLDDLLDLETRLADVGNSSFTMEQTVMRDGKLLFTAQVQLVCVNMQWKPVRVPEDLKKGLVA
jgi:acyl-CoA thioester hydrolase